MEMRRMNASEGPPPGPFYHCFLCTSGALEQVDTGKGMDGGGVFLCTTCVGQAGMLIGMTDAQSTATLNERIDSQVSKIAELERALAERHMDAKAVELARRLMSATSEFATVAAAAMENPNLVEPKPAPKARKQTVAG
jgi:hypothetical protein